MPSNDVELLYETPETGHLQMGEDGKAYRAPMSDPNDPGVSLSGPIPRYGHSGQRGIGGTEVSPRLYSEERDGGESLAMQHRAELQRAPRQLSPAELMAQADQMEKDFLVQSDGSTAVDPGLIRADQGPDLDPAMKRTMGQGAEAPEWLQAYMAKQPYSDPYHQIMPGRVDIINANKYLSEKERLRFLRDEQRHQGLR